MSKNKIGHYVRGREKYTVAVSGQKSPKTKRGLYAIAYPKASVFPECTATVKYHPPVIAAGPKTINVTFPRTLYANNAKIITPHIEIIKSVQPSAPFPHPRSLVLTMVRPILPLSWWFLSGCTGRGLDTRLGLLLTLLALKEFIWGGGYLEETSKPSQQTRRLEGHHLCLFSQYCTI